MGAPVRHDVMVTGTGESDWLPLNRWGSALARIHVEVDGTATYSLVGTHENILRNGTDDADELAIDSHTDNTATTQTTENLVYEAVKLKVTSGSDPVRLRLQTEGDD